MSPVADARPAGRVRRLRGLGLLLGAFSLCAAAAGWFAVIAQYLPGIIAAHFLAAISGGCAGAIADRRRLGAQFFPWVMAFAMPLLGGSAAYFLLETMKKPRTGRLLEEYAAYLNDAASYRESVPVQARPTPTEVVSLGDVLSNPVSDAEQRIAIEYLSEMETQAAFDILRKAVSSAGSEAYFFAMTAMTRMEDKMLARLGELEDEIRQGGEDRVDAELLLKTAGAYIDFMYYRFATGDRRADYLHRAEALLLNALGREATEARESDEALILLGRVRLALRDGESAATCFSRYIERNPGRSLGYLWRAEAWHLLGNLARLRADCRAARDCGGIPHAMLPVLDFWLPETPGAAGEASTPPGPHFQPDSR